MSQYTLQEANYSELDKNLSIAIITAQFNKNFTDELEELNKDFLVKKGFENISIYKVPGAYEIPGIAKQIIDTTEVDLIICLWVVIKWDTPHFDYVCWESARWIMNLTINSTIPLMNGIITCYSEKQVTERIKPVYALSWLNTLVAYNQVKKW